MNEIATYILIWTGALTIIGALLLSMIGFRLYEIHNKPKWITKTLTYLACIVVIIATILALYWSGL